MINSLNNLLLAVNNGLGLDYGVRRGVLIAFGVLMTIAAVAIIVVIMMQKGTNDNVGVIYYGKNKERNKEGVLKKITVALFVFILVCAIICFVIGLAE